MSKFIVFLYIMVLFFTLWSFSLHYCPFLYIIVLFFTLWSFSLHYCPFLYNGPFLYIMVLFLHYDPFLYIMVLFLHYDPFLYIMVLFYIFFQFLQNVLLILVWIKPLGKMRFYGVNYTGILNMFLDKHKFLCILRRPHNSLEFL